MTSAGSCRARERYGSRFDWVALRARTEHHPYAEAFLLLAERLGIADRALAREGQV
ncbi:MAG TPA: hypothetical protein VF734_19125 [Pseudonocardiaceae bacterium]